jgi:hypothetical protein
MGTEPVAITGYTYDELMLKHECPWAKDHQEGPRRLSSILDRCLFVKVFHLIFISLLFYFVFFYLVNKSY